VDFSKSIGKVLNQQNITPSDLARMTGYSAQYILDVMKGNRRWNETTLTKTCDVLGLEIKLVPKKRDGA
jgi:predicted transcriptional regulator